MRNQEIVEKWNKGTTMQDISTEYQITRERIRQILGNQRKKGIDVVSAEEWRKIKQNDVDFIRNCSVVSKMFEISKYWRGNNVKNKLRKLGMLDRCMKCGIEDARVLQVHHIDKNRSNNSVENLLVVCANCHQLIHKVQGF